MSLDAGQIGILYSTKYSYTELIDLSVLMPPSLKSTLRIGSGSRFSCLDLVVRRPAILTRPQSTDNSGQNSARNALQGARWLPDIKARIGKCIMFGLNAEQTQQAGLILRNINDNWRDLLAGSEGFVTGRAGHGLWQREVAWGEMVYCPCGCPRCCIQWQLTSDLLSCTG